MVHTRASCYCSSHFPVLPGNLFSAAECLISFQEPECSVEGVKIFFTLYTELWLCAPGGCLGQPEELWPLVVAPTHRAGPVVAVLLICSCVNNFLTLVLPTSSSQLAAKDPWCRVKGFGSSCRRCPERLLAGCSCLPAHPKVTALDPGGISGAGRTQRLQPHKLRQNATPGQSLQSGGGLTQGSCSKTVL